MKRKIILPTILTIAAFSVGFAVKIGVSHAFTPIPIGPQPTHNQMSTHPAIPVTKEIPVPTQPAADPAPVTPDAPVSDPTPAAAPDTAPAPVPTVNVPRQPGIQEPDMVIPTTKY